MNDIIRLCNHCNNITPHQTVVGTSCVKVYDEIDEQKVIEQFQYLFVKCGTCGDFSLLGGFLPELPRFEAEYPVLFPASPELDVSVPEQIRKSYSEAARIRTKAPNAFAGQIRRGLEYLCKEQKASGKSLYTQLKSLIDRGIIPPVIAEMTSLIRLLGNIGVHATEVEIDSWDTILIDEFFRSIIEYVYVAPAKIRRLKERLQSRNVSGEQEVQAG